jgi:hypothetical protein
MAEKCATLAQRACRSRVFIWGPFFFLNEIQAFDCHQKTVDIIGIVVAYSIQGKKVASTESRRGT